MANIDVDALRAFLDQSANTAAPAQEPETQEPETQEPVTQTAETTGQSTPLDSVVDNSAEPQAEPTPVTPQAAQQTDKDNNAFAEMRVANKQMQDMLSKIADAYGIQYTDANDMMTKLNDDAITKIAEKKGIPVEFLKRMESLEADANAFRAQQNQARLVNGFREIQSEFGCSNEELQSFAKSLDDAKVDLNTVNLKNEYIARNYQAIMQKQIEAAVQAALKGDAAAGANSTTPVQPGTNTGSNEATTVKSVGDLRALLNQLGK